MDVAISTTRKVSVLFGAGASVDAGLPMTRDLAKEVVSRANDENNRRYYRAPAPWVQAINFIYGAMVDFGSRDGGNPLGSVDFERLISALRFLQNKEDHEVSPFVLTWRMGTSGFERTQEISTRSFERAFDEAVGKSSFGKNRLLEEIKKLINNSSDPSESFLHAENNVLGLVKEILGGLKNTDYLTPLASLAQQQDDGLDILTLNYDLAVEKMAQERGVKVNYGFSQWTAGIQLNWSQEIGTINIIKMHGSLRLIQKSSQPHKTPTPEPPQTPAHTRSAAAGNLYAKPATS